MVMIMTPLVIPMMVSGTWVGKLSVIFNMKSICYYWMVFVMLLSPIYGDDVSSGDRPVGLSPTFRLIGNYQLNSKIRVERGKTTPVVISPMKYKVYSDGIEVRLYYQISGEYDFITYQIYRSDGIGVSRESGEIDLVAGVQALNQSSGLIRQLSITGKSFTMVNVPPRSHRVIITRAFALKSSPSTANDPSPGR